MSVLVVGGIPEVLPQRGVPALQWKNFGYSEDMSARPDIGPGAGRQQASVAEELNI